MDKAEVFKQHIAFDFPKARPLPHDKRTLLLMQAYHQQRWYRRYVPQATFIGLPFILIGTDGDALPLMLNHTAESGEFFVEPFFELTESRMWCERMLPDWQPALSALGIRLDPENRMDYAIPVPDSHEGLAKAHKRMYRQYQKAKSAGVQLTFQFHDGIPPNDSYALLHMTEALLWADYENYWRQRGCVKMPVDLETAWLQSVSQTLSITASLDDRPLALAYFIPSRLQLPDGSASPSMYWPRTIRATNPEAVSLNLGNVVLYHMMTWMATTQHNRPQYLDLGIGFEYKKIWNPIEIRKPTLVFDNQQDATALYEYIMEHSS